MRSAEGRRRRLLALCLVALLGLLAVLMAEGSAAAEPAHRTYLAQQNLLASDLRSARAEGFASDDLQPIVAAQQKVDAAPEPVWVGDRPAFYRQQAAQAAHLGGELAKLRAQLTDQSRQAASSRLQDASAKIAEDAKLGADDADLKPLQADLDQANQKYQAARTLTEFRATVRQLEDISNRASEAGAAQRTELGAIQQAADQLKSQPLDAVVKAAKEALATGRDEAVAATWLKVSGFDRSYRQLEKYAALAGSGDQGQALIAAAAVRRYADQIHQALLSGVTKKAIVVSIVDQHLSAYDAGKVALETYVTTGRPPDLATDVGPMKVLRKDSPWKMHSPWPKSSPFWYPDATVQRVVWFTVTGEGLHDASWQPDGTYGPGSQYGPSASHGCIHVPPRSEVVLYDWADAGTPVVIIPGGGQPLTVQLAQKTTDDAGNPLTGPKGA